MLRDIFVSLFHLANVQFRKSLSFLERDGWRVAVTSSRSLASTGGEGSILPLLRLSPRDPLRWAPAGAPDGSRALCLELFALRHCQLVTAVVVRVAGVARVLASSASLATSSQSSLYLGTA